MLDGIEQFNPSRNPSNLSLLRYIHADFQLHFKYKETGKINKIVKKKKNLTCISYKVEEAA